MAVLNENGLAFHDVEHDLLTIAKFLVIVR